MAPTDIEGIIQGHPDEALRLTLASGDSIDIPNSDSVRIVGTRILILPRIEPGRYYAEGPIRYVSTVNVAMIQPVIQSPPPSAN